jgi:glycosyltransferase involved in cell wall biosynthesis
LQSYREAFELNEIPYHIINLEQNGGQANAINEGLKIFKGDYITWPDSDDVLSEVSIEEKVNYMENYKVDFIRTDVEVVKEGDIEKCLYKLSDVNDFSNDEIFNDLIFERNVYFCPGGYMVTRKAIINSIPNLHIYPSRFGQNWQILLPISEKYSCHYLDKCHYKYVVREGSHSRINKDDVQKNCDYLMDIKIY